jgi:AsmA family protein
MPPVLRRALLALAGLALLLVLLAGGALALLAWRPDLLKGQVERLAGAAAGAPVRIAGPLGVELGRVTTVTAEGVAVDAPDWAASPALAEVRRLLVSVDLGAYLRDGEVVLPELRLEGPSLALERDAQGRTSWPAPAPAEETAGAAADSSAAAEPPAPPRIGDLAIEDGRVAYRDAVADVALEAAVATVRPDAGAGGGAATAAAAGRDFSGLRLDGRGTVRGDPLAFDLEVGSPLVLASPGQPFPVRGELSLAGSRLALDGAARDPLALAGLDVALRLASDDPAKLLALAGRAAAAPPPPRDLAVDARLLRDGAGPFELADLRARWAESRVEGRLGYDPAPERPLLTADLRWPLLDLAALAPAAEGWGDPATDEPRTPDEGAAGIPVDARLSLAAERVRLPGGAPELRGAALGAALDRGRLTLDPLRLGVGEAGRLEGRVETGDLAREPVEAALRLGATSLDLSPLRPLLPEGRWGDLAGRFTGTLEGTLRGAAADVVLGRSDLALDGAFEGLRYAGLAPREARLEARLADGRLRLEPLRLALPDEGGALAGGVALANLAPGAREPFEAALDLDAEGLALEPLLALAGDPVDGLAGRFTGTLDGTLRGADAAAILAGSDLTLAGSFAGLRRGDLRADRAELTARLADGRLALDPLRLALPQGRLAGSVAVADLPALLVRTSEQGAPAAAVDLEGEGIDLAALLGPGGGVGGTLRGTLEGTVRGAEAAQVLARSELAFAGRVERPVAPRIGDRLGEALELEATLRPPGRGGEGALRATATGAAGGEPLRVELTGDELGDLLTGEGSFPVALRATLGETRASAEGTLALPLATGDVDAALSVEGPDPAPVLALLELPEVTLPPYRVAGNLTRRGETYRVRGLEGRVGDSDVAGTLEVRLGGARPFVGGELRSRRLDLDDLGGLVGAEPGTGAGETAAPEQRAEAAGEARDGQVLPDEPIDTSSWRSLDLDVALRADEVAAGRLPFDGFELRARLDAGRLAVEPLALRLGEGSAAGRVAVDASREGVEPRAELELDLARLPVARLLDRLAVDAGSLGTLSGRARGGAGLGGRGYSVAGILGSADGEATLLVEGGTLNRRAVTALGFDLLRLFGTILGAAPEEVRIACAIADLAIRDGVVTTRSLAVDTPVADIGGEGTIDLGTERIDIALVADPEGVAVPGGRTGVRIGGTLANPEIDLNAARLLARGAAAATLGVFLSPLTRLADSLGVDERRRRAGSPCAALLEQVPAGGEGAASQNR